eukprot:c6226_g2_i1 orf=303-872(+)
MRVALSWQHLNIVELVISEFPLSIKHSSLFAGVIKTIKTSKHLMWIGKPEEDVDSSLGQSIWWQRNILDGPQVGMRFKKEAMSLSRKGVQQWKNLWDAYRESWLSGEVLRQRYKLSMAEIRLVKRILEELPDRFPTNTCLIVWQPLVEWKWRNGNSLAKTSAHAVYEMLSKNEKWYISLNTRWRRDDSP